MDENDYREKNSSVDINIFLPFHPDETENFDNALV